MNVLLVGINSKYIHPAASIYSLAANLNHPHRLLEFSIKDSIEKMVEAVLAESFDLLGISCYIWNIKIVEHLVSLLRKMLPVSKKIVLGGPEVGYDPVHFLNNLPVDFIISDEGECALNALCDALDDGSRLDAVSNLSFKTEHTVVRNNIVVPNLMTLKQGHGLVLDKSSRYVYFEASRGCPFRCSYCVASLQRNVRAFDIDLVKKELIKILSHPTNTIKFLDRTFNLKQQTVLEILDVIDEHNIHQTKVQFEIVADLISPVVLERISHMKHAVLRFEIGIQSLNERTNELVDRHQDFERLKSTIRSLQATKKVDLHLDLIAGLPEENLESFIRTFDQTYALDPKELQLGFLKLLRGTKLRNEFSRFGYSFDESPPYEVRSNLFLTEADLNRIRFVERVLEKFHNSGLFCRSMQYVRNHIVVDGRYFDFFYALSSFMDQTSFDFKRYQLDQLFDVFHKFIYMNHPSHSEEMLFLLKQDYLTHFQIRPKIWWNATTSRAQRSSLYKRLLEESQLEGFTIDDCYRYCHIETYKNQCFAIFYKPKNHRHLRFDIEFTGGAL